MILKKTGELWKSVVGYVMWMSIMSVSKNNDGEITTWHCNKNILLQQPITYSQKLEHIKITLVMRKWHALENIHLPHQGGGNLFNFFRSLCSQFFKIIEPLFTYWISYSYLRDICEIQYIPRNIHTVFALLCFVVVIYWLIFPYHQAYFTGTVAI